jgi:hypothetical protein
MSMSAWVFMLLVWGVILLMTGYCFYKLLTSDMQLGGEEEPSPPSETGITKLPGD